MIDHGTPRGYQQHRRLQEPVADCGCREANAKYKRQNQHTRRELGLPDNNNRARRAANKELASR